MPGSPVYVYIMELADGRFYVGQTSEPVRRHQEHRRGQGSRTSRVFGAGRILFVEAHPDRASAMRREAQLKGWSHLKKTALIDDNLDRLHELARHRNG